MSYEWHATFALRPRDWGDLEDAIQGRGRFSPVDDLYARLQLLAQSVEDSGWNTDAKAKSKTQRLHGRKVEIPISYQWVTKLYHECPQQTRYTGYAGEQLERYGALGFSTPALGQEDLARLPLYSFFLSVPFALAAPYISKDDEPFYVHENPVRKDPVIRVPIVSSTGWKGAFRAALRWELNAEDDDDDVVRLVGNAKGAEEGFRRARLHFYPTFFDALQVGVINPHDRESGAGTQPIYIEQVPRGARGAFALLYAPIVPDTPSDPLPGWEDALRDLELVGRAARALLTDLGFGAKTGSGMGRAGERVPGAYLLMHRGEEPDPVLRVDLARVRDLVGLRERIEEVTHG
jgi:hypothetical protein